jgi:hypothetical protein
LGKPSEDYRHFGYITKLTHPLPRPPSKKKKNSLKTIIAILVFQIHSIFFFSTTAVLKQAGRQAGS